MYWTDGILLGVALLAAVVLFHGKVRNSRRWRATVTPMASIIGSGFLISAPLLGVLVGNLAPVAMLGIVTFAFAVGGAVRFNIRHLEPALAYPGELASNLRKLERLSSYSLAAAYVISVAFYLRLLASFVLHSSGVDDPVYAQLLTTAVLAFIGLVGFTRGLHALEVLEEYSVTVKLSIIAALLAGLAVFDLGGGVGAPEMAAAPALSPFEQLRQLAGLLLIVQGFETSRYLGAEYDTDTRIWTMRFAQLVTGAIYVLFALLALPLVTRQGLVAPDETAIIDLTRVVSPLLPAMLVIAAAMSQFSAAVADSVGAGGLVEESSGGRLRARSGYLLIAAAAILLVWTANIFQIISIASRAFAFYYLLQTVNAFWLAGRCGHPASRVVGERARFGLLAAALLFVVVFGHAAE